MRFRFVHAADLHLDSPFEGLPSAELARRLEDATLDAFDAVVDKALEVDAAFLALAGDLYDGIERGARAQLRFQRGLRRLSERGVRAFVAHGNHDPADGRWSAIRAWPPGVHVFGSDLPGTVPVMLDGQLAARVHGVSYGTRAEGRNLARLFPEGLPGALDVGVLHTNVGGDREHGDYAPCTLDDLLAKGLGYWALGHIHGHRVLARAPSWVVYPGCTQGRSFKPGDRGEKGAVVVEVEDGAVRRVQPFATDRARFLVEAVDLAPLADLGALQAELERRMHRCREAHPGVTIVLRVELVGRGALHREVRALEARQALVAELAALAADLDVHLLELLDAARPELDLAALLAGEGFAAEVARTLDGWTRDGLPARLRDEALVRRYGRTSALLAPLLALPQGDGAPRPDGLEAALAEALERLDGGR